MGHLAEKGLDQRAFAATIGSDQCVNAAGGDLKTDLLEDSRAPKVEIDSFEVNRRAVNIPVHRADGQRLTCGHGLLS